VPKKNAGPLPLDSCLRSLLNPLGRGPRRPCHILPQSSFDPDEAELLVPKPWPSLGVRARILQGCCSAMIQMYRVLLDNGTIPARSPPMVEF